MSTAPTATDQEQLAINTIRTLAMDAVEQAKSGHPGTPMALAPVAYVLWNEVLRYDPKHPLWPGRDRFVLSCGHASMLLYAVLHLAEVEQVDSQGNPTGEPAVSLEQIKNFRQLGSRTPGHPEYGETSGVETTTGPLGQGCGNSVGMAAAGRWLAEHFNRPGLPLFDYNVYVLCSDGDLMEGLGSEAASLAGHLKLSNLCWIYDDNRITIEGSTDLAFSEQVAMRFQALGWQVLHVEDANDLDAIRAALAAFHEHQEGPTLIILRSHIAWGAPNKQDTAAAHGAPLGEEEVRLAKQNYGWPPDAKFLVPEEVRELFRAGVVRRGGQLYQAWQDRWEEYRRRYPELARQWEQMAARELPPGALDQLPEFPADEKGMATRKASGQVLNAVAQRVPWLLGGSADLAPSNNTLLKFDGAVDFLPGSYHGRNFHFGVREHAMGAAANGMALCGLRPYTGTFLVFSDYMRPSIRLAAMMKLPVLFIFTHDSIGVGEDGPTHQPVEHLAALRAIPNLVVLRPADANEVSQAYRVALQQRDRPVALILTRQSLPVLDRSQLAPAEGVARGGYVLLDAAEARAVLLASGSEVPLCVAAAGLLEKQGVPVRVVSMPSWELFDEQPEEYRQSVLPPQLPVLAVEAAVEQGWQRYLGTRGAFLGMRSFGVSAPGAKAMAHFGFTPENVAEKLKQLLARG